MLSNLKWFQIFKECLHNIMIWTFTDILLHFSQYFGICFAAINIEFTQSVFYIGDIEALHND